MSWEHNRGTAYQAAEVAELTHQMMSGTVRLPLPTSDERGEQVAANTSGKRQTSLTGRQSLVPPLQVNSTQLSIPKSKPHPKLLEKVPRANQKEKKPQSPVNLTKSSAFLSGKILQNVSGSGN